LKKILTLKEYNAIEQAYEFMMQIRFIRQVTAINDENRSPNNYINPRKLPTIEKKILKEIPRQIEKIQTRLSVEFTGTNGLS
jgi:CBS domain-containing protein